MRSQTHLRKIDWNVHLHLHRCEVGASVARPRNAGPPLSSVTLELFPSDATGNVLDVSLG